MRMNDQESRAAQLGGPRLFSYFVAGASESTEAVALTCGRVAGIVFNPRQPAVCVRVSSRGVRVGVVDCLSTHYCYCVANNQIVRFCKHETYVRRPKESYCLLLPVGTSPSSCLGGRRTVAYPVLSAVEVWVRSRRPEVAMAAVRARLRLTSRAGSTVLSKGKARVPVLVPVPVPVDSASTGSPGYRLSRGQSTGALRIASC